MNIDTNNLVSITEANQNFSKIARMVDENGSVVILKNNAPRYVLVEFNEFEKTQQASDEDVLALSKSLMKKNKKAYEVLVEMIKLSTNQILLLHKDLISEFGGLDGVKDLGMLESAINAPFQTFNY